MTTKDNLTTAQDIPLELFFLFTKHDEAAMLITRRHAMCGRMKQHPDTPINKRTNVPPDLRFENFAQL
jgi:hypothetical protein